MPKRYIDNGSEIYEYLLAASSREDDVKKALREETSNLPDARMQITPEQGQFMALLVKLIGAKLSIEIGTFTGYSALCVAEALPEDGRLIACDISKEWTSVGRPYWEKAGVAGKIDLRIAPAMDTLSELVESEIVGKLDFAFIDADKTNYDQYYEYCLTLVRVGGLIVLDNALWGGQVVDTSFQDEDTQAIRAMNEKLRDDSRVDVSLLSVGDGIYLARKR